VSVDRACRGGNDDQLPRARFIYLVGALAYLHARAASGNVIGWRLGVM
jgi:hypothetical protein